MTEAPEALTEKRAPTADRSWMLWTALALATVWVGVILISVFAPDLVSGSQQEHLPLAAMTTWLWGLVGTAAVFIAMNRLRGDAERKPIWIGFAVAIFAIWLAGTLLSIFLPVMETGTDPTRLPLGAMITPLAAALLTALAGMVAVEFGKPRRRREM
jgi:membrane associated rhomboid family serine protease